MAIITQAPAYTAQDNFWDRVRKPVGAGLMARGTPLGLLLGALLGAAKAPSDVKAEQDAEMRRRQEQEQMALQREQSQTALAGSRLRNDLLGGEVNAQKDVFAEHKAEAERRRQRFNLDMATGAGEAYSNGVAPDAIEKAYGVKPSVIGTQKVAVPGGFNFDVPTMGYPKLTKNDPTDALKGAQTRHLNALADSYATGKNAPKADTKLPDGFVEVYKHKSDLLKKKLAEQYELNQKKVPTEKRNGLDEEVGALYREVSAMEQKMKGAGGAAQAEPAGETKTIDFNSW